TPATCSLRCGSLTRNGDSWLLERNISLWIAGPIPARVEADAIVFSVPAGEHEIMLVVWSQPVSALLHPVAFALSRRESGVAAAAASWLPDRLPLFLPT